VSRSTPVRVLIALLLVTAAETVAAECPDRIPAEQLRVEITFVDVGAAGPPSGTDPGELAPARTTDTILVDGDGAARADLRGPGRPRLRGEVSVERRVIADLLAQFCEESDEARTGVVEEPVYEYRRRGDEYRRTERSVQPKGTTVRVKIQVGTTVVASSEHDFESPTDQHLLEIVWRLRQRVFEELEARTQ
jgi:hypothetical protein